LTIRNTRELDIIKLINSFINTLKSKATLLPRLYKTADIEPLDDLLQKSVIDVRGRCANADAVSRVFLLLIDMPL
jgi:hypothetical protein